MAATHKSWRKVNKTQFNPLWWVFLGGFNRFKPGGLNWVGFNPSNPIEIAKFVKQKLLVFS